ncbi:MAG: heparinase II/III family protein [Bacteroidota bacterium]
MRNRIVILIWFMVGGSQGLALQAQANLRGGVWPPLFQQTVNHWKGEVQGLMEEGILVPTPKDMAGGYSHEVHKRNFFLLPKAAALYQLTGEEKYAAYVKEVFFAYAKAYPGWGKHPSTRSYARGKIFWQCLNDANWLVYMSQAYAGIYDMLSAKERETLETQLFRPCADYLSLENPRFFNRIHNHSTWGNAAVGMIALVMQDDVLLNRALYGLEGQPTFGEATDNDGGRINIPGQNKAGFLAQLDHAFSPDGYYTEGPYYQRYAMSPFIMFAQVLHQQRPELGIFAYRDSLLKKAVFALLQQTDGAGAFFPINDAQKGMSYLSRELIQAVDVVYALCGKDARLLSVAEDQGRVLLDKTGYTVAEDLAAGEAKPFHKWSQIFTDGANGDEGALAILRPRNPAFPITAVFKYAAQGMGHGHFDRLSYALYEGSTEALQDYGSARWVNIDQKGGGGYLKENKTWAKQSLAHNTLILDQTSHFQGKTQKGSEWAGEPYFSDLSRPDAQVVSAKETHAYPGVTMQRTLCLLEDSVLDEPILLDRRGSLWH